MICEGEIVRKYLRSKIVDPCSEINADFEREKIVN